MSDSPQNPGPSSLKIYFRLLGYVKPYIGMFLLSIVGFLIFASTQPMLAGILKYFVDGLSNPDAALFPNVQWPWLRDLHLVYAVPLLIILIAAWQGLGSFLGNFFLAKVSLGWCMTCGSPCSTSCWCCRTAISTRTAPAT
ncbi:transport protein MsbA [Pseudomonas aeruginosa PA38182]|nr:transport protein MsbA [Pseudomonas aeruginosa PA38182]